MDGQAARARRGPRSHLAAAPQPHLRASRSCGSGYGRVGDVPVVGSWNGSARTGIGVERDGQWLLRNRRSAGPAGIGRDVTGRRPTGPVVGDWDGNGTATPGVVRGPAFLLRAGLAADAGTRTLTFRG